jgi:pimeloyl-ACP methyl ester carboxylesterase
MKLISTSLFCHLPMANLIWRLAMWLSGVVLFEAFLLMPGAGQEAASLRSFFYIGGRYAETADGHIFRDQMYVEKLEPIGKRGHSIVLIHGQAQTGTNWLNKPDGGVSWTSRFLEHGYTVYIVDQTFRGRSAWLPGAGAATPSTYSAEYIQQRFTAPQKYGLWEQARLHTQWPDGGVMGEPVFDAFYSSNVQFVVNATYQQSTVQAAGAQLLDKIGPTILLGHSQGGLMPPLIADVRPNLTVGIILIEPNGPPFQDAVFRTTPARAWGLTDVTLTYDPPGELVKEMRPPRDNVSTSCVLQGGSPRRLKNLAGVPFLVVTGEASYHAAYDYCTVEYLRQAGCRTQHMELGEVGIRGNGHMLFMEKNSDQIWEQLHRWIREVM